MGPPGHPFRRHLGGTGKPEAELLFPALALGRVFLFREGPRFGPAGLGLCWQTRPLPRFESWGSAAGWRGDALSFFI